MNPCLVDLFDDDAASTKLTTMLPVAFEMASLELPGKNPAVGFLREHAITGFFKNHFGRNRVIVPEVSNKRGSNVTVCEHKLLIMTVTGNGGVKISWTADADRAKQERKKYLPGCDIFLTRIYWGSNKESIFYIPVESQEQVFFSFGRYKYLKTAPKTNNRGMEISKLAMEELQTHKLTKKMSVNWQKVGLSHTPYDRWEIFWKERINSDAAV